MHVSCNMQGFRMFCMHVTCMEQSFSHACFVNLIRSVTSMTHVCSLHVIIM